MNVNGVASCTGYRPCWNYFHALIANLIQLQISTFLQLPTSQYHPRGKIKTKKKKTEKRFSAFHKIKAVLSFLLRPVSKNMHRRTGAELLWLQLIGLVDE